MTQLRRVIETEISRSVDLFQNISMPASHGGDDTYDQVVVVDISECGLHPKILKEKDI